MKNLYRNPLSHPKRKPNQNYNNLCLLQPTVFEVKFSSFSAFWRFHERTFIFGLRMASLPPESLNIDALLVSAIAYASEALNDDMAAEALTAELFEAMTDIAGQAGIEEDIPELPKTSKQPRPVRDTHLEVSELGDNKLVQWSRYVSMALVAYSMLNASRFTLQDLHMLVDAFEIPNPFITTEGDSVNAVDALVIMCNRFAYPSRLSDLADRFTRSIPQLSRIINQLSDYLYRKKGHLLTSFKHFSVGALERFASAIHAAGCPMTDVIALIDATFEDTACPTDDQHVYYSGYSKTHAYKFQGLTTPDGMIALCHGPIEGRRADGALYAWSGLAQELAVHARGFGGRELFVYADPAYGESAQIVSGLKKVQDLTPLEQQFNTRMAKLRMSVEWGFGKVANYWAFLNYAQDLSVHKSPIARYFLVAVLLTNCHTCLHGSETSRYFGLAPPKLDEYLKS